MEIQKEIIIGKKGKQNTQELLDSCKRCKICIIETLDIEQKDNGAKRLFKLTMMQNFLNSLVPDTKPQIQEAQRIPSRKNTKKQNKTNTQTKKDIFKHIIFKLQKTKGKQMILKKNVCVCVCVCVWWGWELSYLWKDADRIILNFQSETTHARREWGKIFQELKEKKANLEFCV